MIIIRNFCTPIRMPNKILNSDIIYKKLFKESNILEQKSYSNMYNGLIYLNLQRKKKVFK